ncbi:MAG: hypothetical protein HOO92_17140 [Methylococcaceae bacterium]|nr:hypothetical protein [Methylococcaceae bacterium]
MPMAEAAPFVEIQTNIGTITVELYPDKAPITVENFLKYVDDKFYQNILFHRVVKDFVVQGGGFGIDGIQKNTLEPIELEVNKGVSNIRGTIAMARTDVLKSATSQFFINTKDNVFLDTASGGYAAFGTVVGGLEIVDAINATPGFQDFPIPQGDGPLIIEAAYKLEALNTARPEIRITLAGDGAGIVSSSPKGLKCGTPTNSVCQTSFDPTKTIKLTAKSASNSIFSGWRGDCKGVLPGLKVPLTKDSKAQDANCTAVFRKK